MNNIYIGTSGYMYKSWNEKFFPKGLAKTKWLHYYSEHFKTLEINATFYGWFQKKTFEKWRNETMKDFKFAIKGPRRITHLQKLLNVEEITRDFFENASGLEEKLLVVLWQFPKKLSVQTRIF